MKSVKRVFNKIRDKNPSWSSYLCFAETVARRKFAKATIHRYFNKLVNKDDYDKKDKRELLGQLFELSQGNQRSA